VAGVQVRGALASAGLAHCGDGAARAFARYVRAGKVHRRAPHRVGVRRQPLTRAPTAGFEVSAGLGSLYRGTSAPLEIFSRLLLRHDARGSGFGLRTRRQTLNISFASAAAMPGLARLLPLLGDLGILHWCRDPKPLTATVLDISTQQAAELDVRRVEVDVRRVHVRQPRETRARRGRAFRERNVKVPCRSRRRRAWGQAWGRAPREHKSCAGSRSICTRRSGRTVARRCNKCPRRHPPSPSPSSPLLAARGAATLSEGGAPIAGQPAHRAGRPARSWRFGRQLQRRRGGARAVAGLALPGQPRAQRPAAAPLHWEGGHPAYHRCDACARSIGIEGSTRPLGQLARQWAALLRGPPPRLRMLAQCRLSSPRRPRP